MSEELSGVSAITSAVTDYRSVEVDTLQNDSGLQSRLNKRVASNLSFLRRRSSGRSLGTGRFPPRCPAGSGSLSDQDASRPNVLSL